MIWLLPILGLVVIAAILFLVEMIKKDSQGGFAMSGIVFFIFAICISVIWLGTYYERWNAQRQVEAFISSKIFTEYRNLIGGSTNNGNLSELVDLEPIGTNVQEWFRNVNWVNRIIRIHTAANENWWLNWGYPDWESPPELITFQDR